MLFWLTVGTATFQVVSGEWSGIEKEESTRKQTEYARAREDIASYAQALRVKLAPTADGYVPIEERGAIAGMERELELKQLQAERLIQEAQEALERAARLEAPWGETSATREGLATMFLMRWREAVSDEDSIRSELFRAAVDALAFCVGWALPSLALIVDPNTKSEALDRGPWWEFEAEAAAS